MQEQIKELIWKADLDGIKFTIQKDESTYPYKWQVSIIWHNPQTMKYTEHKATERRLNDAISKVIHYYESHIERCSRCSVADYNCDDELINHPYADRLCPVCFDDLTR